MISGALGFLVLILALPLLLLISLPMMAQKRQTVLNRSDTNAPSYRDWRDVYPHLANRK